MGSSPIGPVVNFTQTIGFLSPCHVIMTLEQNVVQSKDKTILLGDDNLLRWYKNVNRGSKITADVYLRTLRRFCEHTKTTPTGLVSMGKKSARKVEDLLMDFVDKMEERKHAPQYIGGYKKAVKSWMQHNDIELKRNIKIRNVGSTPTLENERIPTKDEMNQILAYADERTKVMIALVSQSGLRPESIGNYTGTDGLRIQDLPEMTIKGKEVAFTRMPTMIVVRNSLSKAGHKYFTFMTKQGCDFIKAYLEKRMAEGEAFDESSALVAIKKGRERAGKRIDSVNYGLPYIQTGNIGDSIREAMRPRFKWRPYVLRAYFDTQLLQAESHGEMPLAYRKFFMGHKGDMEARYTTNKGRLTDETVEDMRRCFTQSQKYLESIERESVDKKQMLIEMWKEQAKVYGIDPAEIIKQKQRTEKHQLDSDEILQTLQSEVKNIVLGFSSKKTPYKSKIVTEDELIKLVGDGWDLVKELSNGKFLVRCTNSIA